MGITQKDLNSKNTMAVLKQRQEDKNFGEIDKFS